MASISGKFSQRAVRASLFVLAGLTLGSTRLLAGIDFSQCSNENPTANSCHWIGSVLQASNSRYFEGMSTPQRILLTGLTGSTHTLQILLQYTKASKHAYDWIDSWAQASAESNAFNGAPFTFNECANLSTGGSPPTDTDLCNTIVGLGFFQSPDVPDDGFVSTIFTVTSGDGTGSTQARITAFETNEGNRTITIKGDAAVTAASFDAPVHTSDKAGSVVITGDGADADTFLPYTLHWTSTSDAVLI